METTSHLVIFTPQSLVATNGIPASSNDISQIFAQTLASRAQSELNLSSVATKSVGGEDITETFDNFQRALETADCAIIVIPGSQICLLDGIYPLLLIFMTFETEWMKKILLIGLGDLENHGKQFDPSIFDRKPVIFSTSRWTIEVDKWQEVLQFIKPSYTLPKRIEVKETPMEKTSVLLPETDLDTEAPQYSRFNRRKSSPDENSFLNIEADAVEIPVIQTMENLPATKKGSSGWVRYLGMGALLVAGIGVILMSKTRL